MNLQDAATIINLINRVEELEKQLQDLTQNKSAAKKAH